MSEADLWAEGFVLLEEHQTEEAVYEHITQKLRPLLAVGDELAIERWHRLSWMIDQIVTGHTRSSMERH